MALSAAELTAAYTPKEESYTIPLAGGETIVVKIIADMQDLAAINKKAQKLYQNAKKGRLPENWKPFLPLDEATIESVCILSGLILEPKFTDLEALQLLRKAGLLGSYLVGTIRARMSQDIAVQEMEALEETGED